MSEDDELFAHLPRALRVRPLMAGLMPTPGTPKETRGLYPLRMTVLGVGLALFGLQVLIFLYLGDSRMAVFAGLGIGICAVSMAMLRKHFELTALFLTIAASFAYLGALHVRYGLEASGGWLFVFPISIGAFFVFRREEWLLRLVPLGPAYGGGPSVLFR